MRESLVKYLLELWKFWWLITIGMACAVVGLILDMNTGLSLPFSGWLTIGISGLVVAQFFAYHALRTKTAKIAERLAVWTEQRPEIRCEDCGVDKVELTSGHTIYQFKVTFINDPQKPSPSAVAHGIRASISFFDLDGNALVTVDGPWAWKLLEMKPSDVLRHMGDIKPIEGADAVSVTPQLEISKTFNIGEVQWLVIGYVSAQSGKFYAHHSAFIEGRDLDSESLQSVHIDADAFKATVRLRGGQVDQEHWFLITTANRELDIKEVPEKSRDRITQ